MKYILTEDQYVKLLAASRERHDKDPETRIKGGMFNLDGHIAKYNVY